MTIRSNRKYVLVVLAIMSLVFLTIPGIAQESQQNKNTTIGGRVFAPSASDKFSVSITACRYEFDWNAYITNEETGENQNIYTEQGCVTERDISEGINGLVYGDFSIGQQSTKEAFGYDHVVGIFENEEYPAQSLNTYNDDGSINESQAVYDRSVSDGLESIFSDDELNSIYSTGGERSAMPRIFSTGPDEYRVREDGTRVYIGGRCDIENGNIFVRASRQGEGFDSLLYDIDPSNPYESCARKVDNQRLPHVENQSLNIYQFVYSFPYPNSVQCEELVPGIGEDNCLSFFRNRYGGDLAGNSTTGSRIVSTYTYYGAFDDKYSQWVGWKNPDLNSPRSRSTDPFIQAYDGYNVYVVD